MIAAGHDRPPARLFHRRSNCCRIGRYDRLANSGGFRVAQDVNDHRLAMQVGQWFTGQTRGGESRRNEDDCVGHRGCRSVRLHVADVEMPQGLIRVASGQANRYLIAAAMSLTATHLALTRPAPGAVFR